MTKRGGGESEALDRLEADDVVLEKILDDSRCAAARTVAEARASAEAEAGAARRALEAEVAGIREAAARELRALEVEAEARAVTRADGLRQRAAARIEAAVDLALRTVCGEEP